MSNFLSRLDNTYAILAIIGVVFMVGVSGGTGLYVFDQRISANETDIAETNYTRLWPKVSTGTADISQITKWCAAAKVLEMDCVLTNPKPTASRTMSDVSISPIYVRSVRPPRRSDVRWFNQKRAQRRRGRNLSRGDRGRFCAIGRHMAAYASQQTRRRQSFRCPWR